VAVDDALHRGQTDAAALKISGGMQALEGDKQLLLIFLSFHKWVVPPYSMQIVLPQNLHAYGVTYLLIETSL